MLNYNYNYNDQYNLDEIHTVVQELQKIHTKNILKFDIETSNKSNYTLGAKAIYTSKPSHFDLLHEVAHLIQLNKKELNDYYIQYNGTLNFQLPYIDVCGTIVCEPLSNQISMRELETFYIQYLLEKKFLNKNFSFIEWLSIYEVKDLFKWLPDSFNFYNKELQLQYNTLHNSNYYSINDSYIDSKANQFKSLHTIQSCLEKLKNLF